MTVMVQQRSLRDKGKRMKPIAKYLTHKGRLKESPTKRRKNAELISVAIRLEGRGKIGCKSSVVFPAISRDNYTLTYEPQHEFTPTDSLSNFCLISPRGKSRGRSLFTVTFPLTILSQRYRRVQWNRLTRASEYQAY